MDLVSQPAFAHSNHQAQLNDYQLSTSKITALFKFLKPAQSIATITANPQANSNLSFKITLNNQQSYGLKVAVFPQRRFKLAAEKNILQQKTDYPALQLADLVKANLTRNNILGYPFLVYQWIKGQSLLAALTKNDQPDWSSLGKDLAKSLASLQQVTFKQVADPGANQAYASWQDYLVAKAKPTFKYFQVYGHELADWVEDYFQDQLSQLVEPTTIRLVHRDFKAQNLIVDHQYQLAGVIDFEHHVTGDHLFDLAVINEYFFQQAPVFKKAFLTEYQRYFNLPIALATRLRFYSFVLYAGYLQRAFELQEVTRFWSYEQVFTKLLGRKFQVKNPPDWAGKAS
ncbi:MAG: phosphotransferase [Candidatus Pacebacteria bacterium]|nr:phosphotransferase [Candidatus Paceibacterota bacterium]